jgi:hypothetical protein
VPGEDTPRCVCRRRLWRAGLVSQPIEPLTSETMVLWPHRAGSWEKSQESGRLIIWAWLVTGAFACLQSAAAHRFPAAWMLPIGSVNWAKSRRPARQSGRQSDPLCIRQKQRGVVGLIETQEARSSTRTAPRPLSHQVVGSQKRRRHQPIRFRAGSQYGVG